MVCKTVLAKDELRARVVADPVGGCMTHLSRFAVAVLAALGVSTATPSVVVAQSGEQADAAQQQQGEAEAPADTLLTPADLEELVAPIALYPDTLLIQVLVASTYPLQVVKANEFVAANAGADPKALEEDINAQGWDESVAVLAAAFPDVIADMSDNIDWTDQLGTAMLAQSDDVMDAVQVKRQEADAAGNLESNDYQTVEVTQEGDEGDTIIIQPAEPEVVYVPQYDTETVYVESNSSGNALTTGLIAFSTFVLLDNIFDDDDPWNDYWGCRNCGGWGGGPIIRNPDIDIDVDGNVNIGNKVGWKPDDKRRDDARDKIADRRDPARRDRPGKAGTGDNRGDQLRANLTGKTGAQDIARDRKAADRVAGQVGRGKLNGAKGAKIDRPGGLSQADRAKIAERTKSTPRPGGGKAAAARPQVKKPAAVKKPSAAKAPQRKAASNRGAAMHRSATASRAKAGSARGRAAAGGRAGGGRRR